MLCRAVFSAVSLWFAISTVGASGGPPLVDADGIHRAENVSRTISDSRRSFGSLPLPSAYAYLSGAVEDSCLQSFMSLCTPESWSSPFSAKSQLAVAPQSDITQPR
jgi:hypothetical protein